MRNFKWLRIDKHSKPNTPMLNPRTGEKMVIREVTEGLYQYNIDVCAECGEPKDFHCDSCDEPDCNECCGFEVCIHCKAVNPGVRVETVTNEGEIASTLRNAEGRR